MGARRWTARSKTVSSQESLVTDGTKRNRSPEEKAGYLSHLFFLWIVPFLYRKSSRELNDTDICDINTDLSCQTLGERLESEWTNEILQAMDGGRRMPRLTYALWKAFGPSLFILTFGRVCVDGCLTGQAVLVEYFVKSPSYPDGLYYGLGISGCSILYVLLHQAWTTLALTLGLQMRVACFSLLYRKVLRMSLLSLHDQQVSHMLAQLTHSVAHFDLLPVHLPHMVAGPVSAIIASCVLWNHLGPICLVGFAFLAVIIPLQVFVGKKICDLTSVAMTTTGERLRLLREIAAGIVQIKQMAWEEYFRDKCQATRSEEARPLRRATLLHAVISVAHAQGTRLMTMFTITTFVLIGRSFSISMAFLTLCVIQVLRAPLCVHLPLGITLMSKVAMTIRDLESLLLLKESTDKEQRLNRSGPIYSRIILMEVCAKWEDHAKCRNKESVTRASSGSIALATLQAVPAQLPTCNTAPAALAAAGSASGAPRDVSKGGCYTPHTLSLLQVGVKQGELLTVVGGAGSGKSSLLHLLLGELQACSGKVQINGRLSYCAPKPWVFPGTLKRNITCGSPYKEDRFKQVLAVCDLTSEVEAMEGGTLARIGREGITLTKNQQARVSLARAIYQEADIYLLDNPMDDLTRSTSKKLFTKCVRQFLSNKCVVLVTNRSSFIEQAHQIFVLHEGRMVGCGSYNDLIRGGLDLSKYVSFESHEEMEDQDEDEDEDEDYSTVDANNKAVVTQEQENRRTIEGPMVGCGPYSDLVGDGEDINKYLAFESREDINDHEREYVVIVKEGADEEVMAVGKEKVEEEKGNTIEVQGGGRKEEEGGVYEHADRREDIEDGDEGEEDEEDKDEEDDNDEEEDDEGERGVKYIVSPGSPRMQRVRKMCIHNSSLLQEPDDKSTTEASTTISVKSQDLDREQPPTNLKSLDRRNTPKEIILDPVDLYTYCRKSSSNPMPGACSPRDSRNNIFQSPEESIESLEPSSPRSVNSASVLLAYMKAGGRKAQWVLVAVVLLVYQLAICSWDFAFLMWAMDNDNSTPITGEWFPDLEPQNNFYLSALWLIIGAMILVSLTAFLGLLWIFTAASNNLHNRLLGALVRAPLKLLDKESLASFLKIFSQDMKIVDDILPSTLLETVQYFMMIIACVIVIGVTSWILIFPLVLVILVTFLTVYLCITSTRAMKRIEENKFILVQQHLESTLDGICTIRALDAEHLFLSKFSAVTNTHTSSLYLLKSAAQALGLWLALASVLVTISVTLVFGIVDQESKPAYVGLAIYCSLVATTLVPETVTYCAFASKFLTSVGRIIEHSSIKIEASDLPHFSSSVNTVYESTVDADWPQEGQIQANNLSLQYDKDEAYVLLSLNFRIKAGEKVGVVGGLGAGKSALLVALLRLMEPTSESSVLIDDVDTRHVALKTLRERISVVPRFPIVFSGSLRDNLDPKREMPDNIIWDALEKVELRGMVQGLSSGLHTESLAWNEILTMHQRQLFCLARAVLDDNRILIVDMAIGNLNPHHEASMLQAINRYFSKCTVLIVSHRLRSVMKTDRVLVLEQGRMGEFGHPFLLLQNQYSHFYKMVEQKGPHVRAQLVALAREAYLGERLKEEGATK